MNIVVEKLIDSLIDYGHENFWNDVQIIEELIKLGITEEDFKNNGFENFVKDYFDDNE